MFFHEEVLEKEPPPSKNGLLAFPAGRRGHDYMTFATPPPTLLLRPREPFRGALPPPKVHGERGCSPHPPSFTHLLRFWNQVSKEQS